MSKKIRSKKSLQCVEKILIEDAHAVVEMRCQKERKHLGGHEYEGFNCEEKSFYICWNLPI